MVGTNLQAETMGLMETRSALDAEMNAIIERLTQPGGPGISGNLLDSEGFPRHDIELCEQKGIVLLNVAELRSDHKELTEKLNKNIEVLLFRKAYS